jgi:hypothetical protein
MKFLISIDLSLVAFTSYAQIETTPYGKITGIETRSWGMHIQVDYAVGEKLGCKIEPGATYMLDLHKDKVSHDGGNFDLVQSMVLAAYMANKDISFHLYECLARPQVGHVRVRN